MTDTQFHCTKLLMHAKLHVPLTISLAMFAATPLHAHSWLPNTPLKPVYEALYSDESQSAWEALSKVLSQSPQQVSPDRWQPLFWELIANTQCGKALESDNNYQDVRIVIAQRATPTQTIHQVKVALDKPKQAIKVTLNDNNDRQWVVGEDTTQNTGYVEFEGEQQSNPIPSGRYSLQINDTLIPLVLHGNADQHWAMLSPATTQQELPVQFSLPRSVESCPKNQVSWQWFDPDYQLLGADEQIEFDQRGTFTLPKTPPAEANWLSAVVAQRYWNGSVKVIQQQRVTLPKRYFTEFF